MSYYDLCCQHRGQVVQIKEKSGNVHVGKIVDVDQQYVWMERMNRHQGFGYGYYGHGPQGQYGPYSYATGPSQYGAPGPGQGYGGGFGRNPYFFPVALAGIGGFALGTAFFW
ncbi:hypothetical protein [Evansella cellulosilytica]|uniref:Uncharacterized protein n=1 Tax=Evansella cellulosilytica (strain ATCC 21833 / DSM 2522 / FERM P-1141 / JCM 9156 / N-4) TaxID=649639 RepID=E6TYS9_EVAC2|nr:hypothetical protein [Evansella cellulosilytica]ADU31264.1 hypothetical protein Bcell_3014 [Evansella cellulosilytica DSM 2522]